jgi:hypothetical protein
MQRRPSSAHSTYARIVGEVAIAWNRLERRLDSLIYHYLKVDPYVAGFILGGMGNDAKTEFAKFLIKRFEKNALLKEHGIHFAALFNRLRENRNILEHAEPHSYSERYHGRIFKLNKQGFEIEFDAPIPSLKALLKTMQEAGPYARWLTFCLYMQANEEFDGFEGGQATGEAALQVLAKMDRPILTKKIAPTERRTSA